jgi:hypothetical protein
MTIAKALRGSLAFLSALAYIGIIIAVGVASVDADNVEKNDKGEDVLQDPPAIAAEATTFLSIMGAALAVHTGTVLGLATDPSTRHRRTQERLALAERSKFLKAVKDRSRWVGTALLWLVGHLPEAGAVVYVLGVLIAVGFYVFGEGLSPASVPYLRDSWTTLLGVVAGIWGVQSGGTVPVPNLVDDTPKKTVKEAKGLLEEIGLTAKLAPLHAGDNWHVIDQVPAYPAWVPQGAEVTLIAEQKNT